MNKSELVMAVAERSGFSRQEVREILDNAFEIMASQLTAGEKVTLPGFGSFLVADKQPRLGVNPRTLERIEIPAHRTVRFRPATELAGTLNSEEEDQEEQD